ncbi:MULTISPECIES: LCP family protein [Pseudonocardia]|uniref:LytTR family transcriptional regulator n=2 Tax=Pseudonocardia TaxID=1847 RepID=A0ABQ0S327_9PSEU|nr:MULTISPECIES: LCP family protein [Pseudonocardia]OSY37574.1 putative transcriptional regulator YvhJ [Pseudonocardia autotrophica]TDN73696.1 LytR family transcriptional attenuator [Pseudonocardia autotrophica]BBG04440.1 LytTR family transcriptional regulator [Pseudonocardia autotrophica]GEC27314.1 LytTR family transcriptional regulator [Pseudonocardia saturnea]
MGDPRRAGDRSRPARRGRPADRPEPARPSAGRRWLHRFQIGVASMSVLTLLLTGAVWTLYRDVTGGITTTNVIFGGSTGGEQNILLVGVDSRTDAQGDPLPDEVLAELRSGAEDGVLNSDTIIVVHVPADGGGATAFSVPRDSEVRIQGLGRNKINAAYPQTKAQAAARLVAEGVADPKRIDEESSQAGRQALIGAVQDLTGLGIDHYAEVNLLGFYNLTQAIGGVEVCLKAPARDAFSGIDLPAGPQTISGADALAFVRQRHGLAGGDLSRITRQQVFLAAVANKVLSSGTLADPTKLTALIDVVHKSVVIDSGWDILGFAEEASQIAAGQMDFLTIPNGGPKNTGSGDVLVVDPREVQEFVDRHTTPQPAAEPEPAPAPTPVVADVANGSGTTGLAARVAGVLGQNGITPGEIGNAPDRTTSVVRYSQADGDAGARRVADALGGIGVEQSDAVGQGRVQVLIGADYSGGGSSPSAGAAQAGGSGPSPAPAPATPPISAGGVPCID